ncbi:hypothetical protein C1645_842657 [Glomus cerebriforme]|uniref:Uncharacterized protein n=1 Tax=Glomus cerebriforme TaxID=658196 RepID=A0A397S1K9_9GLOM|nr:hypothetical protein C1645_842657 [Glomus cerebriforme]
MSFATLFILPQLFISNKNIFEIITRIKYITFKYGYTYSSLIGYFYQYGIGCEIDEVKVFEIFSSYNT